MICPEDYGLCITAGPQLLPQPFSSIELDEIAEYDPSDIAEALLQLSAVRLLHTADPTWWEWSATYSSETAELKLDISVFGVEPPVFCGVGLTGVCMLSDITDILNHLCQCNFTALWIHDQTSSMYDAEHFLAHYGPIASEGNACTENNR